MCTRKKLISGVIVEGIGKLFKDVRISLRKRVQTHRRVELAKFDLPIIETMPTISKATIF